MHRRGGVRRVHQLRRVPPLSALGGRHVGAGLAGLRQTTLPGDRTVERSHRRRAGAAAHVFYFKTFEYWKLVKGETSRLHCD